MNVSIFLNCENDNYDAYQTADAIKKAGFKDVLVSWAHKDFPISELEIIRYAKKIGLNPFFAHLSYSGVYDIWLDNEDGQKLVDQHKEDIRILSKEGVKVVCIHLSSKTVAPEPSPIGIKRLKELNEVAKENNVILTVENCKIKGYQEYVLENIKDENLGVCIDSGHMHCHFKDDYNIDLFKNRIYTLHLHDNDGASDQHHIPFDGTINWDKFLKDIKRNGFNGSLTLELMYFKEYQHLNIEQFYAKAYEVVQKLSEMYENI